MLAIQSFVNSLDKTNSQIYEQSTIEYDTAVYCFMGNSRRRPLRIYGVPHTAYGEGFGGPSDPKGSRHTEHDFGDHCAQ